MKNPLDKLARELVELNLVNKTTIIILRIFLVVFILVFVYLVYRQGRLDGQIASCPKEVYECCFNRTQSGIVQNYPIPGIGNITVIK